MIKKLRADFDRMKEEMLGAVAAVRNEVAPLLAGMKSEEWENHLPIQSWKKIIDLDLKD